MAKASRDRGLRGERELKNMLIASFPQYAEDIRRNRDQDERGGCDIVGLPGYAPECKNVQDKGWTLKAFWAQTLKQTKPGEVPVLFRKQDRRGWTVYMHLRDFAPALYGDTDHADLAYLVPLSYAAFELYARHRYHTVPYLKG